MIDVDTDTNVYKSVRKLSSRVAYWVIIRAFQSDITYAIQYTPACIFPLRTEDLAGRAAAGVYFR